MTANRRELTESTEVLWSTLIYVPVILFGLLVLSVLEPIAEPYLKEDRPAPMGFIYGLVALLVFVGPFFLRSRVWRPIRRLADACGSGAVFRAYCLHIFRQAYPFIPLVAVPITLLCFNIGGWFFFVQLGVIILADHLIDKWRTQPISDAVDGILRDSN